MNPKTPEWQFYMAAKTFVDDTSHLEALLLRARQRLETRIPEWVRAARREGATIRS